MGCRPELNGLYLVLIALLNVQGFNSRGMESTTVSETDNLTNLNILRKLVENLAVSS